MKSGLSKTFGFFFSFMLLNGAYAKKNQTKPETLVVNNKCLSCHSYGSSLNAPRLHGANKDYLIKQLTAFKKGTRKNLFMRNVALKLSAKEIELLATYFSGFNHCDTLTLTRDHLEIGDINHGQEKATTCFGCHVKDNQVGAPLLDGQDSVYLAKQLQDIKYGRRENILMFEQLQGLSEKDIYDLAAFFGSRDGCGRVKKMPVHEIEKIELMFSKKTINQMKAVAKSRGISLEALLEKVFMDQIKQAPVKK